MLMSKSSARWPVLLLAGLLAACSSNKDATPDPSPLPSLPKSALQFHELWSVSVGDGLGKEFLRLRPAVSEATVYAASRDGVVVALDRSSGKPRWKQKTGLQITGGVSAGYGLVLVGTGKAELVALSAENGSVRWKAPVSASVLAPAVLDANTVVVQSADGKVYGLKRETGERVWVHDTPVPVLSLRGNSTPLLADGMVYLATASGKVEALSAADGLPAWDVRVASNQGRTELDRMVDVDGDMVLGADGMLYSVGFQSQLTAVDTSVGRRRWQYDISSYRGLAEAGGNVYAVDNGSSVFAVAADSGKAVWKQPALAWRGLITPVALGGYVLSGDQDGYVHVLSQTDGSILGRFRPDHDPVAALMVTQDTVYAYSADGDLSAWQLKQQ